MELLEYAAGKGITIVLGGDGGDELFAPDEYSLFDNLRLGNFKPMIEGTAYFTSIDPDGGSLDTLMRCGIKPLALNSKAPAIRRLQAFRRALRFNTHGRHPLTEFARLIGPLGRELLTSRDEILKADIQQATSVEGSPYSRYRRLRRVLDIPFYEPTPRNDGVEKETISTGTPLITTKTVEAAFALRLDREILLRPGFQPKELLREASRDALPASVRRTPKVGLPNVVSLMVPGTENAIAEILLASEVRELGIACSKPILNPAKLPSNLGLYWSFLLGLAVWYSEARVAIGRLREEVFNVDG